MLELGAGVGLPGLLAVLLGARRTVITEYPDPAIMDVLAKNRLVNLGGGGGAAADRDRDRGQQQLERCTVLGHAWGQDTDRLLRECNQDDDNNNANNNDRRFDVILVADCIWMVEQHGSLLRTCVDCLEPGTGRIYLTCYPHTGKLNIDRFFRLARESGLQHARMATTTTEPPTPMSYYDSDGKLRTMDQETLSQVNSFMLWK